MLNAFSQELLSNESSTTRANSVLTQMKATPELLERLREEPQKVQEDFEELRRHCMSS